MWRIFQWMLVMTGIMCLFLLSGGLIFGDLVAVTAHWELLTWRPFSSEPGLPAGGVTIGVGFRRLQGWCFLCLFTVSYLLLFDELEEFCLKVSFLIRFLPINFYLVFLSYQPHFLCIWIRKSANEYLWSIYQGPLFVGFPWKRQNFYIQ